MAQQVSQIRGVGNIGMIQGVLQRVDLDLQLGVICEEILAHSIILIPIFPLAPTKKIDSTSTKPGSSVS